MPEMPRLIVFVEEYRSREDFWRLPDNFNYLCLSLGKRAHPIQIERFREGDVKGEANASYFLAYYVPLVLVRLHGWREVQDDAAKGGLVMGIRHFYAESRRFHNLELLARSAGLKPVDRARTLELCDKMDIL